MGLDTDAVQRQLDSFNPSPHKGCPSQAVDCLGTPGTADMGLDTDAVSIPTPTGGCKILVSGRASSKGTMMNEHPKGTEQ